MLVGARYGSPSEMVGNGAGNPPAHEHAPAYGGDEFGDGAVAVVEAARGVGDATRGLSSALSVYPIEAAKLRRRNHAKPESP